MWSDNQVVCGDNQVAGGNNPVCLGHDNVLPGFKLVMQKKNKVKLWKQLSCGGRGKTLSSMGKQL